MPYAASLDGPYAGRSIIPLAPSLTLSKRVLKPWVFKPLLQTSALLTTSQIEVLLKLPVKIFNGPSKWLPYSITNHFVTQVRTCLKTLVHESAGLFSPFTLVTDKSIGKLFTSKLLFIHNGSCSAVSTTSLVLRFWFQFRHLHRTNHFTVTLTIDRCHFLIPRHP